MYFETTAAAISRPSLTYYCNEEWEEIAERVDGQIRNALRRRRRRCRRSDLSRGTAYLLTRSVEARGALQSVFATRRFSAAVTILEVDGDRDRRRRRSFELHCIAPAATAAARAIIGVRDP